MPSAGTEALAWHLRRLGRALACRIAFLSPRGLVFLPCGAPLRCLPYRGPVPADRLIVFLPGIDDLAEDFAARGFFDAVARRGLPADAVAVDAHYGYYARRSVIERLAHDVVLPARRGGYREVWLAGISMGGLGALSYAMAHPEHVDGVALLAPYLGEGREADEHVRRLWDWIARYEPGQAGSPPIYLGYGTRDRFAKSNARLGARLPARHIVTLPGGHDWRTWKRLWDLLLARLVP